MGHGGYSYDDRAARSVARGYHTRSRDEIFSRTFNSSMNPTGVTVRESRDSEEHPNSLPIIVALDVTGSMGDIPHDLVRDGLPTMMQGIIDEGIADPQVLFMGIGDHECDRAPLQIGQFESSDELMDRWLTDLFIEGGGGGNAGESYLLAWFFASRYTETDHFDRRGRKGLLFTIGDEPCLPRLPASAQQAIMGPGQYEDQSAASLLERAQEKYEVYHLHLNQGHNGRKQSVRDGWRQLLGNNCINVQNKDQVAHIIAEKVHEVYTAQAATPVVEADPRFDHINE